MVYYNSRPHCFMHMTISNFVQSLISFNIKLLLFVCLGLCNCNFDDSFNGSPTAPTPICSYLEGNRKILRYSKYLHKPQSPKKDQIEINCHVALQIFVLGFGVIILLCFSYVNLCTYVSYISFNTDLNLYNRKKISVSPHCIWMLYLITFGLFLSECDNEILLIIISTNTEFGNAFVLLHKFRKIISKIITGNLSIYIFVIANTPATCILCLMVFQT